MKLTSKQRAFLKKKAHTLDALFRIGKEGYSETLANAILDSLNNRELIKVKILQNSEAEKKEIADKLQKNIGVEIVGIIGRTIIIYKENKDKPTVSLELKDIR